MKNPLLYLHILFFSFGGVLQAQPQRYYVAQSASGANTGLSWADAFTDLQTALQAAQAGDEVWVAQGVYKPTPTTDRAISFEPVSGLALYGGFAGTENTLVERDWAAHPTVLSGDIGVPDDSTDNSYNVVYLHQPDSSTVLDGFTLRDGVANSFDGGAFARTKCGGGLYIMGQDWEAYPTIQNCVFENNTAKNYGGGAMVNGTGDGSVAPRFSNCRFENNRAMNSGGGLMWLGASWVERNADVNTCLFYKNYSGVYGGGMCFFDAERIDILDLQGNQFVENISNNKGGGACTLLGRTTGGGANVETTIFDNNGARDGSGYYVESNNFLNIKYITIDKCQFENNFITGSAASSSISNITPIFTMDSYLIISNSVFYKNISSSTTIEIEGANGVSNDSLVIKNVVFDSNSVHNLLFFSSFNKIFIQNTTTTRNKVTSNIAQYPHNIIVNLNDCLFSENNGTINTEYFSNTKDGNFYFQNCAFIKNYIDNKLPGEYKNLFFLNSIAIGLLNPGFFFSSPIGVLISHSYFDTLSCAALPPNVSCGPGILTGISPMFVNPDSGDFRLQPCSPLVGAGSNDFVSTPTDLAGLPRIQGGTVDIGPYEHQGPSLAATPSATPSCPGGASGTADATVQDACPPLQFSWQSAAGTGTGLKHLPAGTYQVTATDARGQSVAFSVTVPLGDGPNLLTAATPVLCGDTTGGSASATLDAGWPPFFYAWADNPAAADSLRAGLPAGAYPVTVTDAEGCSATGIVEVAKSGNLDIAIDLGPISCAGAADGFFTVSPANGKAPFHWQWAGGAQIPTIGPLGPGDYLGTLTDALGCTIGWILPLGEPDPLQANPSVTPASDSLASNGSIQLQPSGGTPPYTAQWSTGATGLLLDSLPAGFYNYTLTDDHGCSTTGSVAVGVTSNAGEVTEKRPAFSVLPNPARETVRIVLHGPAPADVEIRLVQASGGQALRALLPAGAGQAVLYTGSLPRGLYVVQVGGMVRKVVLY